MKAFTNLDLLVMSGCVIWLAVLASFWPAEVDTTAPVVAVVHSQIIAGRDEPIAIYDPAERALTVTAHAPRETLICLRHQCKLVEEWIER